MGTRFAWECSALSQIRRERPTKDRDRRSPPGPAIRLSPTRYQELPRSVRDPAGQRQESVGDGDLRSLQPHHAVLDRGECREEYSKQNIIMLGPTGVGKTYLVRKVADLIGVPFVKGDATKFSETGYVGGDVEDLVRELVHKADGNIRLAEYGIIYLDEIDKIAAPSNFIGRDVSGGGVQRGLLKLMEETEVSLRTPFDLTSQLQAAMEFQSKGKVSRSVINTRHILFIVSGAFSGLSEIVRKRMGVRQHWISERVGSGAQE